MGPHSQGPQAPAKHCSSGTINSIISHYRYLVPDSIPDGRLHNITDGLSRIFAKVTAPLTYLTRKDIPYHWSLREREAFNTFEQLMTETPALQLVDPNLEYIVRCHAIGFAVGAILSQIHEDGGHPMIFKSRKGSQEEYNYPTYERELVAVIHALRTWRNYLEGSKFKIITDHNSLK